LYQVFRHIEYPVHRVRSVLLCLPH
jgi:hypothetical protein